MKYFWIILKKELKDTFRDKRAVFIAFVFPLLLLPALLLIAGSKNNKDIMLPDKILCSVCGRDKLIADALNSRKNIEILGLKDPLNALEKGEVHAVVSIRDAGKDASPVIDIICDNTRQTSVSACAYIFTLLESYKTKYVLLPVQKARYIIKINNLVDEETGAGKLLLSMILPLLLLVYSSATPAAVAADLGAGEKERNTLWGLLTMPVRKEIILAGKYAVIVLFGLAGLVSFMSGTVLAFIATPEFLSGKGVPAMHVQSVMLAGVFAVLLVMFFGAVELAVSLFAGSVKEAQIIFIPVLMTAAACGYGALFYDPKNIAVPAFNIPLVNISLTIKQLALDIINWPGIVISILWTISLVLLLFFTTEYFLRREKNISK